MSLAIYSVTATGFSFPRPRGDEPQGGALRQEVLIVFPARAGMSPAACAQPRMRARFPRPRGDEPVAIASDPRLRSFSPPARG